MGKIKKGLQHCLVRAASANLFGYLLIISLIFNITYLTKNNKISAGTSKVLDIRFIEGNNFIKVVCGSGTLTVKYQEGTL